MQIQQLLGGMILALVLLSGAQSADAAFFTPGFTTSSGGGGGISTTSLAVTAPITITPSAASVTFAITPASASNAGSLSLADFQLIHTATTTFSSPLVYTLGTNAVTLQAASASQNGYLSLGDFQLFHAASTTFSSPLVYTLGTNSATVQAASASQNGYLSLGDFQLIHAASTTYSSPLVYTLSTNAVTCPTCSTITTPVSIANGGTNAASFTTSGNGVYYNGTSLLTAPLTSAVTYPYASTTAITSTNASTTILNVDTKASIGSTTPWATFSVVSPTNPLVAIASSSGAIPFFGIFSTTTIQQTLSSVLVPVADSGIRTGIGTMNYTGFGGLLDQFVVRGRINTEGWNEIQCDLSSGLGTTAAGSGLCGAFNTGVVVVAATALSNTGNTNTGYAYASINVPAGTAINAGTFYTAGEVSGGTGWMSVATGTPVMEVNARIEFPQNSTSTSYYIGFDSNGSSAITTPSDGCYFTASSTQADWRAIARSVSTETNVDTGIASSTNITSKGSFQKFRIEADSAHCAFYIQNGQTTNLRQVANITTNIPTTIGMHTHIWLAETGSGLINSLDFNHFRIWWRDFLPAS